MKEQIPAAARHYAKELMDEVNADREAHGRKPFDDDNDHPTSPKKPKDNTSKKKLARRKKEKKRTVTKSVTDPECGLFVKGEHKKQFAYEAHTACDGNGFVLETVVTPGNVHDSAAFDEVYDKVTEKFPQAETIERVFADAKEKHAMRYTQYRGLAQVTNWVKLKFAAMNLKKLAVWKWNDHFRLSLFRFFCPVYTRNPVAA